MKTILACTLALSINSLAYADEDKSSDVNKNKFSSPDKIYINPTFGFSPDMGILGIEIQKGHHIIGVGIPGNVSYKWFSNPSGNSKFYSLYGGHYSLDSYNDEFDNIYYRNLKSSFFGAGIGYRWQWQSGWNISASVSLEHSNDEYSNPNSPYARKDISNFILPGVVAGYKF